MRSRLSDGEHDLWIQMSNPDRRHAVGVAKRVECELGGAATDPVLAAALLHDVGKIVSGLRTPARVGATLVWSVLPSSRAALWLTDERVRPRRLARWRLRLGQYHLHPQLGEGVLEAAGADPLTSGWAGDHHRTIDEWRVDQRIGRVLKACDDD